MTPEFQGRWRPLYAELNGEQAPMEVLQQTVVELQDGRYAVRFGHFVADEGTYALEAGGDATHRHVTLHGTNGPNAGRAIPCLYKFIEDTLMICYGLGGTRPSSFGTKPDSELYLVTYQRKP